MVAKIASFNGTCPACAGKIAKGSDSVLKHEGEWIHEGCIERYNAERQAAMFRVENEYEGAQRRKGGGVHPRG